MCFDKVANKTKDLLINNDLLKELLSNALYSDIIKSKPFKRLNNISFLGAIDYKYKNHKRFYRYEHSLSVATLGLFYAKLKKLNQKDTDYLVVSALLHDIGHSPLSHSAEFGFKNIYGINHHDNGNNIISGKHNIFKNIIKNILNKYSIDEKYIIALLNKEIDNEVSFVLNNPINIDTVDGILRSYLTFNYKDRYNKMGFVPKTTEIIKALFDKDEIILDKFWSLKHRVYNDFIHKEDNLYIDILTQEYIEKCNIPQEQFYIDDSKFLDKNKILLQNIYSIKSTNIRKKLKYNKRKYITTAISYNSSFDIYKRYKYQKSEDEKTYIIGIKKCDSRNLFEGL